MSINIGTEIHGAIVELRGNREVERVIDGMADLAQKYLASAIAGPVENRVDQTAYARGLFDLWEGFRAAYLGQTPAQTKSPPLPRTRQDKS